jgi:hypothetical protein
MEQGAKSKKKCLKCAKLPLRAVGPTGRGLKCLKLENQIFFLVDCNALIF